MVNFNDNLRIKCKTFLTCLMLTFMFGTVSSAFASDDDIKRVRDKLAEMIPQAQDAEIVASPAQGVYRVLLQGSYVYAHVVDDLVLLGELFDIEKKINLGDQATSALISDKIKAVPTDKMIVFGDKKSDRHITVFTDIDCGYCRKLHNEVPALNAAGIEVRYLAYPRAGIGSKSYDKYVSVWCNDDPQAALTDAKAGKSVKEASCENPIAESFELGREVGVRGTPTMIFDDGSVVPGYISAEQLIERLGVASTNN